MSRPPRPASVLAEINDLTVEIDGHRLVDRVTLTVAAGRVIALVGASGSGKTTTGLALLGEYPAGAQVTGEVRVHDARVGYIPQHPAAALNPARRAGALLFDMARGQVRELPRALRRRTARQRVLDALKAAQLPDAEAVLNRYPHQLSGGQQQRVVLAQALLIGARVIVADEPTTGQDALTKRLIVDQLAAVARRGIAVVLLSHDLDVVRELADEVLVLRGGRVVESGPAHRLMAAPVHTWTRELLIRTEPLPERSPLGHGKPLLQVRDLVARHRGSGGKATEVLRTARLDLRTGECLAVVGRSGSGKTTLARCLAGLHREHEGEVLLDGRVLPHSLRDRSRRQLAAVQYVFQDARAAFDAFRPVLDQVARTAVRLRGMDRTAAAAEALGTLSELGLGDDLVRRLPGSLSGGELQRAALARALLARPRVLVCDEITSGLDPVARRALLDLLTALLERQDGPAVVLITHDLETAAALATHIAVLDGGQVVEQGVRHRVLTAPRHPFTVALLGASNHGSAPVRL